MQLAGMLCWGDAALPYALLCVIRQFPWQRLCVRGIATYRVVFRHRSIRDVHNYASSSSTAAELLQSRLFT